MSDLKGMSYLLKEKLAAFSCSQPCTESGCQQVGDGAGEEGRKWVNAIANDSGKASCSETDNMGVKSLKGFSTLGKGAV